MPYRTFRKEERSQSENLASIFTGFPSLSTASMLNVDKTEAMTT